MADTSKPSEGKDKVLPNSGDVLSAISSASPTNSENSQDERQFVRKFDDRAIRAGVQYEHLLGVKQHYTQKGKWSIFLMSAVGGMLLFQSILLVCVGLGWMSFENYEWLLPALLVQNLGQVIGLAVFAVKYLFSDISTQGH